MSRRHLTHTDDRQFSEIIILYTFSCQDFLRYSFLKNNEIHILIRHLRLLTIKF